MIDDERKAIVRAWYLLENQLLTTDQVIVRLQAAFPYVTEEEAEYLVKKGAEVQYQTARAREAQGNQKIKDVLGSIAEPGRSIIIDTPIEVRTIDGGTEWRTARLTLGQDATFEDYKRALSQLLDEWIKDKYISEIFGIDAIAMVI